MFFLLRPVLEVTHGLKFMVTSHYVILWGSEQEFYKETLSLIFTDQYTEKLRRCQQTQTGNSQSHQPGSLLRASSPKSLTSKSCLSARRKQLSPTAKHSVPHGPLSLSTKPSPLCPLEGDMSMELRHQ